MNDGKTNVSSKGLMELATVFDKCNIDAANTITCGDAGSGYLRIANIIESEDSNLAECCRRTYTICEQYKEKMQDLLVDARESVKKYAESTLANELAAQTNVTEVNTSLDNISSALDSLDF